VNVTAPPVPDAAEVSMVNAFCWRDIEEAVKLTAPPLVVKLFSIPM
jgi:hypothetical protein